MIDTQIDSFSNIPRPIVTTGTFDGLHLGHQKVLSETVRLARLHAGNPVILTFWPHPRYVLSKGEFLLLNSLEEKKELFHRMGFEHVYFHPFTKEFSQLSSEDYIKTVLINKLHVNVLVIGYDHQFGKERSGKFETIGDLAKENGFSVERVEAFDMEGLNVSSTKIRNALSEGNVHMANQMLGYDYFITGKVVEGNKIGRTLGFPTANIKLSDPNKMLPGDGIYAVYVRVLEKMYKGMMSIGYRPTFPDQPHLRTVEVNIFDFEKEIYNSAISVYFHDRLRDEYKFSNTKDLIEQMGKDRIDSLRLLKDGPKFLQRLM